MRPLLSKHLQQGDGLHLKEDVLRGWRVFDWFSHWSLSQAAGDPSAAHESCSS